MNLLFPSSPGEEELHQGVSKRYDVFQGEFYEGESFL